MIAHVDRQSDATTWYAQEVVAGRIVAGRMVRLECERHLRDLEFGAARGLQFKPDQAQVAFDFFENVLCLPDEVEDDEASELVVAGDSADDYSEERAGGKPFLLSPFQKFIVGSSCGWFKRGRIRFRVVYIETGKGSGKTPLAAGILLFRLVVRPGIGKQNYIAATQRDQAMLTFTDCVNMVNASPHLKAKLVVTAKAIAHLKSGSFIKPISAEKRGLDGKRVDGAVADEVHEHIKGIVVEKLRACIKNRKNAQIFLITNSGHDKTTICWELHEYARQLLEGTLQNDAFFTYVCQLDPCAACYEKGKRMPQDACPNCDKWYVRGEHWRKVNPNLDVSLSWEYLEEQVQAALGMPTQQALVMRLNFCIWTEQHTVWIQSEKWASCIVPKVSERNDDRLACALGLDLSTTTDLTAACAALRYEDAPEEQPDIVEIEVTDDITGEPTKKTLNLNYSVELIPSFWMPEDRLNERVEKDRVPFNIWKKDGHLNTTIGPIVDYDTIYDHIVKDVEPKLRVQQIGYDPYNATMLALQLRDKAKLTVVEVKQGKVLSEAGKLFEALILSGRLRHAGNPVMGWCVANAMADYDKYENLSVVKPSARQRIDGVIAALIALYLLVRLPARKPKGKAPRVWTPNGFVPAVPPANAGARDGNRP